MKEESELNQQELEEIKLTVIKTSINTTLFSAYLAGKDNPNKPFFQWEKDNDIVESLIGMIDEVNSIRFNADRPTPVVETKTAEEIKKVILSKIKELKTFMHNEDDSTIRGSYYVSIQHMYSLIRDFDAKFTPSAKSVEVEEGEQVFDQTFIDEAIKLYPVAKDSLAGPIENETEMYKAKAKQLVFTKGAEFGATWQQQKQADAISHLTESLKTIYSLAKPGSAIYEICDKALNPKK